MQTTDAEGKATVGLNLERFADATYEMTFSTEGFEAEGGRSVHAYNTLLVSALPRVIGYKPDASLNYLPKDSAHSIDFIAIDRALNKVATEKLQFDLIEQTYVSILAKKENGNYAYESVLKERPVKSEAISIDAAGFKYPVPTNAPGNYVLQIHDESGRIWNKLSFCRRRPGGSLARARQEFRTAGEAQSINLQRRRRNRDRHDCALHRQRPDHDRERQGLRASMVHQQHDEQRAAHPRAGRFRRDWLRQCFIRARSRFERKSS